MVYGLPTELGCVSRCKRIDRVRGDHLSRREEIISHAESGELNRKEAIIISEAARLSLKHLISEGIPPIPTFFSPWFYAYLDLILEGNTSPSQEEVQKQYQQMLEKGLPSQLSEAEMRAITALSEETRSVVKEAGKNIVRAIEIIDNHNSLLEEKERSLSAAKTINSLISLIESLQKEIRELRRANEGTQDELKRAANTINKIEDRLKKKETEAQYDPLTIVANRRLFENRLKELMIDRDSRGTPCSLIMIDVDDFKRVNDLYGHRAGDEVLRSIALALERELRTEDMVGRYGGEEFVVLLPENDLKAASSVAERLRERIQNMSVPVAPNSQVSVTISLGVAEVHDGDTPDEVVSRADRTLYLAKKEGKNCVRSERDLAKKRD